MQQAVRTVKVTRGAIIEREDGTVECTIRFSSLSDAIECVFGGGVAFLPESPAGMKTEPGPYKTPEQIAEWIKRNQPAPQGGKVEAVPPAQVFMNEGDAVAEPKRQPTIKELLRTPDDFTQDAAIRASQRLAAECFEMARAIDGMTPAASAMPERPASFRERAGIPDVTAQDMIDQAKRWDKESQRVMDTIGCMTPENSAGEHIQVNVMDGLEPAPEKPAAQSIGVDGFDSATIHVPGAVAEEQAKINAMLNALARDPHFQGVAKTELPSFGTPVDPFAGPIQIAWAFLRAVLIQAKTRDEFNLLMTNMLEKVRARAGGQWVFPT